MSKKELFTNALKKAKEGNLFNYDKWLEEKGIRSDLLKLDRFKQYFGSSAELMINNEKELEVIAQYIGSFLRDKKQLYHLAIIGVKGSGKTILMNIVQRLLVDSRIDCRYRRKDALKLEEKRKGRIITSSVSDVIAIDDCDKVILILDILRDEVKRHSNCVFLTFWTPESWMNNKLDVEDILPISEELHLNQIKKPEIGIFLHRIFHYLSKDKSLKFPLPNLIDLKLIDSKFYERIYNCTLGNPLLIIKLVIKAIEETFLENKEFLDLEIINLSLEKMGLCKITNVMNELSSQHLKILETILLEGNREGARPIELVEKHHLDKSTISYHLNVLLEKGILRKRKIGKSSLYKIKKNLVPFIQLKYMEMI